jgi:hypothetical protein
MEPNISVVNETPYGIYVWKMPNGAIISDSAGEDRNYLCINARKNDLKAIMSLTEVVRSFGIDEGEPWFLPGYRKVADEEYERQKERLERGLIPDELDLGAWKDEAKYHGKE